MGTKHHLPLPVSHLQPELSNTNRLKLVLWCIAWYISSFLANTIGKTILSKTHAPVTLAHVQFLASALCIIIWERQHLVAPNR